MKRKYKPISEENPGILQMEMPADMLDTFIDLFNIEIEVLRGTRETLPGNWVKVEIEVTSEEKAKVIQSFILRFISKIDNKNFN